MTMVIAKLNGKCAGLRKEAVGSSANLLSRAIFLLSYCCQ